MDEGYRDIKYGAYGAILGAVGGPAFAVFLAEHFYNYSTIKQISLDVAVAVMAVPVFAVVGNFCGRIFAEYRNYSESRHFLKREEKEKKSTQTIDEKVLHISEKEEAEREAAEKVLRISEKDDKRIGS
jgi:hypothetical protein